MALALLTFGMLVAGVWRHLTRQFTRFGLALFLVSAGFATLQAQKRLYVAAEVSESGDGSEERPFKTLQEAVDVDSSSLTGALEVVVRAGVYSSVKVDAAKKDWLGQPLVLTIAGETNALGSVVIDGGGDEACVDVVNEETCESRLKIRSIVLRNGTIGVSHADVWNVKAEGCGVGLMGCEANEVDISRCFVGAERSHLKHCVATGCDQFGFAECFAEFCYATNNVIGTAGGTNDTCLLAWNDVGSLGGVLFASTVAYNRQGGALDGPTAFNTVICNNGDNGNVNYSGMAVVFSNCCIRPLVKPEAGNVEAKNTLNPVTCRLRYGSPAYNAGNTAFRRLSYDLDGGRRVNYGKLDIGAYEYGSEEQDVTRETPIPVPHSWLRSIISRMYSSLPLWHEDDRGYVMELFGVDKGFGCDVRIEYFETRHPGDPWPFIPGGGSSIYDNFYPIAEYRYEDMAKSKTGKLDKYGHEYTYWEEYVMGTDPLNVDEIFQVDLRLFDGRPYLDWSPKRTDRCYFILGTSDLSADEWRYVPDPAFSDELYFKVGVELK